jgi:hypothetical protein
MLLIYMGNVITLSECNCGVQRERSAISRKTSSWATSVINLVQRRNDRTGLKILENNKNIQSIISVNTNILLRRFRLKFLRIMYSTSCYKEPLNFENTLYHALGLLWKINDNSCWHKKIAISIRLLIISRFSRTLFVV